MERNCHRCNKRFNPDNSESETVCQSCMDLQKAGKPRPIMHGLWRAYFSARGAIYVLHSLL